MRFVYGITGNYYVTSLDKTELVDVCQRIGKSEVAIKWYDSDVGWVIRVKDKKTKIKLKDALGDFGIK
jgi:hypothetical protein